jgi:hypothetical protein
MGDIWDVLPPREHPDLDAVRHFATVLVSQLVAERQLYIAYEPDWERRGLESLHNELWPKLGPYCWEFQIPFFRAVFCESIQHPVEQLSLLAGLAYPEGRARLLKLVRPMCMNGIAPTRALSVGMPYIKGRPFVEAEIAANAGTDAMFENHEYWPMRLLYSGGSVGYPNFLGSRLWGPLQLCAVAGVFAVALGGQLAEELCSFSECEFHDTGLCRMWPSKPVDRISQCEFREWYMNFFDQRSLLPRTCGHCEQGIRLKVAVTLWPV